MYTQVIQRLFMDILKRFEKYDKDHCWQYDIRLKNLDEDLTECGLTIKQVKGLRVSDFDFKIIEDKDEQKRMVEFIKRHEWLGTVSQYPTHWFGAYYNDILAGVIIMNMPNSFSKILGDETRELERLISRGACISWSPKNLASSFLMWSIKWMVENTQYRVFTAYSDPQAKELGSIYQACNFYYMGKKSGTTSRYINPYTGKMVSDRFFRQRSAYKKYAKELNIEWQKNWTTNTSMAWDNIPDDIEKKLREFSKYKQSISEKIEFPSKHKYAFVLGRNKRETKKLRRLYEDRNKVLPYPKNRGE